MNRPESDPATLESRVGPEAVTTLTHAATVRMTVTLIAGGALPLVIIASAAIPLIRDYATIPIAFALVASVAAVILVTRWWSRRQAIAAESAYHYLGLQPPTPPLPPVLLRHGAAPIDAWLAANGIRNPATGLAPHPLGAGRPPFQDTMRIPVRVGVALMFAGMGLLVPWAALTLIATVTGSPNLWLPLLVAAFVVLVVGMVVTIAASRARVRRRIDWARPYRSGTP